jgi:hypothetical protein
VEAQAHRIGEERRGGDTTVADERDEKTGG